MANNVEREVLRILNDIIGVEEHLRSGTHGHEEGWSTATAGIEQEQRARLLSLRKKLARKLRYLPEAGLEAIRKLLDGDSVLDREFLEAQLEAADLDSDRVSLKGISPEKWS